MREGRPGKGRQTMEEVSFRASHRGREGRGSLSSRRRRGSSSPRRGPFRYRARSLDLVPKKNEGEPGKVSDYLPSRSPSTQKTRLELTIDDLLLEAPWVPLKLIPSKPRHRSVPERSSLPRERIEVREQLVSPFDGRSDLREDSGVHPRFVDFASARWVLLGGFEGVDGWREDEKRGTSERRARTTREPTQKKPN